MASRYLVSSGLWNSTARWSASLGGPSGASVPTSVDDVFLPNAFNLIVDSAYTASCKTLDCTGYTGTLSDGGAGATILFYGNVTLSASMEI